MSMAGGTFLSSVCDSGGSTTVERYGNSVPSWLRIVNAQSNLRTCEIERGWVLDVLSRFFRLALYAMNARWEPARA